MSESEREDLTRPPAERGPAGSDRGGVDPGGVDPGPDPADADPTEGEYTEVDGSAPHRRTVAGAYTSGDGVGDDETIVGDYTSTEQHPEAHDPSERRGRFASNDPGHPHRPKPE